MTPKPREPNPRYTCPHHQRAFAALARRFGCSDPEKLDDLGRKTLAWLSIRFPQAVLEHFNEKSCLGCKLDADRIDAAEIERVIAELARDLAR